jgi:hypothetical protein
MERLVQTLAFIAIPIEVFRSFQQQPARAFENFFGSSG